MFAQDTLRLRISNKPYSNLGQFVLIDVIVAQHFTLLFFVCLFLFFAV